MSVVYIGAPRTEPDIVAGFATFGVATVHEAQGRTGLMLPYMRPVYAGAAAVGTAVTVSLAPCNNWMLHVVVDNRKQFEAGTLGLDLYGMRGKLADKGLVYKAYGT